MINQGDDTRARPLASAYHPARNDRRRQGARNRDRPTNHEQFLKPRTRQTADQTDNEEVAWTEEVGHVRVIMPGRIESHAGLDAPGEVDQLGLELPDLSRCRQVFPGIDQVSRRASRCQERNHHKARANDSHELIPLGAHARRRLLVIWAQRTFRRQMER